ncbi:hypothetical protein DID88_004611 [Monilinia fructigena]|uniref:NAD(P)-binding domain-containing protein n=1 Tax=Monilinia fructigena TaxID=38457 RepID=A0A395IWP2_9HELO|nr:hypothetical protein DID88_004611 [Monilinia fructigena]
MHFLILGASGRTGSLVLAEALSKNHTVTALARNPSSIPSAPGLTIIKGTPTSAADLTTAFTSGPKVDAVLVTLSSSRASDSPFAASTSPLISSKIIPLITYWSCSLAHFQTSDPISAKKYHLLNIKAKHNNK